MSSETLKITTPSDTEIAMTRTFDAPRHLVWKAITTPELVKRWLGRLDKWDWAVCEMDVRVGGKYRFVWRGPGGAEMGMGGVYKEVTPPTRLVASEKFDEAWYEGDGESRYELTEKDGKTTLALIARYASKQARDGVLQSPATSGVEAGFDMLAEVLATLSS